MSYENIEIVQLFSLEFPYSKEIEELNSDISPNLLIENTKQSYYSILKYIRNELIPSKLKSKSKLTFDIFVNDVLGIDIPVDQYYPPENLNKLDRFITVLKNNTDDNLALNSIYYYILKDFSSSNAENFIRNSEDNPSLSLKISEESYALINSIYYIDRFDIGKFIKYINSSFLNVHNETLINRFIKLANVIPYSPKISAKKLHNNNEIQSYIELESCKETSLSVISIIESFDLNPLLQRQDVLIIYLVSLTEISPFESLKRFKEIYGNYNEDTLKISLNLILKIIVLTILKKSFKASKIISSLYSSRIIKPQDFDLFFERLPFFQLLNTIKLENEIIDVLKSILNNEASQEEVQLTKKYPSLFSQLYSEVNGIKTVARNVMELKNIE